MAAPPVDEEVELEVLGVDDEPVEEAVPVCFGVPEACEALESPAAVWVAVEPWQKATGRVVGV